MLLTPLKFLWKLLSKDIFAWLGQVYDFVAARPELQRVILLVLTLITFTWGVFQCKSRVASQKNLRVATGIISRLQTDSTTQQQTINAALAKRAINYALREKEILADSIHADTLSLSELESENDSLLRTNRAYIQARTRERNQ